MSFLKKTKSLLTSLVALLRRSRRTLLLVAIVTVVTLLLSAVVAVWLSNDGYVIFPSVATIRTSGLKGYWDADFTNETTEIPWGQLYPGSAPNVTVYLRSISNVEIAVNMTHGNWTFINSRNETVYGPANGTKYMNLTWDYDGSPLSPGQAIQVTFTLRVEVTVDFVEYVIEKDMQQFSFDIYVRALE